MSDEARELAPVRFFNDPRLPLDGGVRDFTPRYETVNPDEGQHPQGDPRDQSGVYGGKVRPTGENPVVLDPKGDSAPGSGAGDAGAGLKDDEQQDDTKSTASSDESVDKSGKSADQSPAGRAAQDAQDEPSSDKGVDKAPSREQTPSSGDKPQTPTPQTSEPTNAEVKKSAPANSRNSGSTSKSQTTKKTTSRGTTKKASSD